MRRVPTLLAAAFLCAILSAGCGGNNTYNPALFGGGAVADFVLAAFAGPPNTVGSGSGQTPISQSNPVDVPSGGSATITPVVTSVNGFSGAVSVSVSQVSSGFTVTQPSPSSLSVPANGFANTSFTVSPSGTQPVVVRGRGSTTVGSAVVTATGGNITKTFTVFFRLVAPAGDFSITAYTGDPNSVGDGTGRTPNSSSNRANVQWGATRFITFVLRSLNGFTGQVTVTAVPATSPFTSTNPAPSTINLASGQVTNTSLQLTVANGTSTGTLGQTTVTATSGNISKTITIYYSAEAPD